MNLCKIQIFGKSLILNKKHQRSFRRKLINCKIEIECFILILFKQYKKERTKLKDIYIKNKDDRDFIFKNSVIMLINKIQ